MSPPNYTDNLSFPTSNTFRRRGEHIDSLPFKKRRYKIIAAEMGESLGSSVSSETSLQLTDTSVRTDKIAAARQRNESVEENSTSMSSNDCLQYIDRSDEKDDDPLTPLTPFGSTPNFPAKMYAMLANPMLKGIAEWLPHGRSWRIINQKEFEKSILPIFFDHAKFSSFVRQANGWGFRRINSGPDKNSYYHEYFLRGLPHLCKKLTRPGRSKKAPLGPMDTPDLYKISELHPLPEDPVPDEAVLLLSTIRNGPKAKVPVSFRLDSSNPSDVELPTTTSVTAHPVPMTREILENMLPLNKNPSNSSLSTNSTVADLPSLIARVTPASQCDSVSLPSFVPPQPPQALEYVLNSLSRLARPDSKTLYSNL